MHRVDFSYTSFAISRNLRNHSLTHLQCHGVFAPAISGPVQHGLL
ncbi:hypothetical protein UYSO10_0150 [Kosakonia radicincitans]|nr:hypothetical protein UYSO10_0150 [Kosakonia radicincitans]